MATEEITNSQDIIDSRDVIARIADLESNPAGEEYKDADGAELTLGELTEDQLLKVSENDDHLYWEEAEELIKLRALQNEVKGYVSDWEYGAVLIRDSYFEDYAQELAEDIGAINKETAWPYTYIDWDKAADALKQDYTEVDFDGVTYWVR